MKCLNCKNTTDFLVEGKDIRQITDNRHELKTYFVPTRASCLKCKGSHIEMDELHPELVPFADGLGLSSFVKLWICK